MLAIFTPLKKWDFCENATFYGIMKKLPKNSPAQILARAFKNGFLKIIGIQV